MGNATKYQSVSNGMASLGSVIPLQLVEDTSMALNKLKEALCDDVTGYVANRLHMTISELGGTLAAEQVDGVALALYNIEKRAQSVIIGDQTGIGKGRQAAAMIRYGLLSGYLPIFFTERYTLFSDMYRDCKALGIKDARPLVVNEGASVVDFDHVVEDKEVEKEDEIWSPVDDEEDSAKQDSDLMQLYQKQYEIVYRSPKKKILQEIFRSGDVPTEAFDYLMITYSQLKDAKKDATRLDFLQSLCEKHRVLFIFDEAHRSSSVSAKKLSVITQGINKILSETPQTQCVFLSATFAKRPESLITFMRRTALSALATENTLEKALHNGGVPMQEYVSSSLASEGQMIRREHSSDGLPAPTYTYLDDDIVLHAELFDKVMYYFREIVKLSSMVHDLVNKAQMMGALAEFKCYPTRAQLFYINKVLLLSLKAQNVAHAAVKEVKEGRSVVIGMSDTLECILKDVMVMEDGSVRGDISALLLRLLDKTVRSTNGNSQTPVFDLLDDSAVTDSRDMMILADEVRDNYKYIVHIIMEDIFHLPMSPIDVIRQLITRERFVSPDGSAVNIRFEECTGRAHQLEYLSPDGNDDYVYAEIKPRKKRHSNQIFNDFQNNKIDVILINACGAIGASAHAIATTEVPDEQVRQRKMLIVQNDLDVNIDLQKRGRINRTGQRADLPPLYEYIITAIPSEKRLNMMLRAKIRSLSANTAAWQDQDKEQADFVDISNKYGNQVADEYMEDHPELSILLGLRGEITASKVLARIAMLSVTAQQDIVDDLISAYTTLEAELRRINQWDLEREYRDFEAEYVREELFTTAQAESKLGGCSYLTTYKCKQKTFPYTFSSLQKQCQEAKEAYGTQYLDNTALKKQVSEYYTKRNKVVRDQFKERHGLLYERSKRVLLNYQIGEDIAQEWLQRACKPTDEWTSSYFIDVDKEKKAKLIMRTLVAFSNEYNHLDGREKSELKKNADEKKRLVEILSKAEIGRGFADISSHLTSEECPERVMAVLKDIRFGKDEKTRFQPSKVELVFALTAVFTELRINLVHNKKLSNYDRLREILSSNQWICKSSVWDAEIARNNNKVVERKIITGNILGAYVHPAIEALKPRFISFSLKSDVEGKVQRQSGLLLPMDESKVREAIKTVSVPLHEGLKYANNTNTSYTVAGTGVNFNILPYRISDITMKFVISVTDKHSRQFENDRRFDGIRSFFNGKPVTSIYDKSNDKESEGKKRKPLMHYQTIQLSFTDEAFQNIMMTLSKMNAVIIVPRDQLTYGDVEEYISRSQKDANEPWEMLDWRSSKEVPLPPVRDNLLMRISSPIIPKSQRGKLVPKHSELYLLAKQTMELSDRPMGPYSATDDLRTLYIKWKAISSSQFTEWDFSELRLICRRIMFLIEYKSGSKFVDYGDEVNEVLQDILDSEYLDEVGLIKERFEKEMLFFSPDAQAAQAFLDDMPCTPDLDNIRRCVLDYLEGKTEIIHSPNHW